jgi:hypothetical protein
MEHQLWNDCTQDPDPTKNWEPAKPGGRYAVCLSGGMRDFVATFHSWKTNVIEASGSDNVDVYFHVRRSKPDGRGVLALGILKCCMTQIICWNDERSPPFYGLTF